MIDRILLRVLALVLFAWQPAVFAAELLTTLPSIGMRGAPAAVELLVHGALAVLCMAAAWSLRRHSYHGPVLSRLALIGMAVVSIQKLYWSVLPSQTIPGTELTLGSAAVLHSLAWLGYLHRSPLVRRIRA